jgi:hypothetical protein
LLGELTALHKGDSNSKTTNFILDFDLYMAHGQQMVYTRPLRVATDNYKFLPLLCEGLYLNMKEMGVQRLQRQGD